MLGQWRDEIAKFLRGGPESVVTTLESKAEIDAKIGGKPSKKHKKAPEHGIFIALSAAVQVDLFNPRAKGYVVIINMLSRAWVGNPLTGRRNSYGRKIPVRKDIEKKCNEFVVGPTRQPSWSDRPR